MEWKQLCREYLRSLSANLRALQPAGLPQLLAPNAFFACIKGYDDPKWLCADLPHQRDPKDYVAVAFSIPLEHARWWDEGAIRREFDRRSIRAAYSGTDGVFHGEQFHKKRFETGVKLDADIHMRENWPQYQIWQIVTLIAMRPTVDQIWPKD